MIVIYGPIIFMSIYIPWELWWDAEQHPERR